MTHCRWNLLPPAPARHAAAVADLHPLLVQLLYNRGITTPDACRAFLGAGPDLLGDPFKLPDMEAAVGRICRAILSGEKICVYGDFDADGITATAVLVQGLQFLGGTAVPYIPHRQAEGHGLSSAVLKRLHEEGVSLVITVDCGVTDVDQVKKANRLGLDVIITDHHTPLEDIPPALAVIDPKLERSEYGFTGLAGVGVAWKLLQALFGNLGKEDYLDAYTDLVAIGTVADMSPPLGENRYLIRRGLEVMNGDTRLGLKELISLTRLKPGTIDADNIGWVLAPCLNAAGRLADGLTGYNLLVTLILSEARELAAWLTRKNEERQRLTQSTLFKAREHIMTKGLAPLLLTADKDYPSGITGLVAGRLTEEFYRPSIVIHTAGAFSHASCRSIPEFNIVEALHRFGHLFTRYGGHAAAAGFTLPTRNLPEAEEGLVALAAEQLEGIELRPHLTVDAEITLPELAGDVYPLTRQLAPFGIGNPVPAFVSRNVEVLERRTMGNDGSHLRFRLRQGDTTWDAVAFRLGNHAGYDASRLDIVYNLEIDTWNGRNQLRLNILDFQPSA